MVGSLPWANTAHYSAAGAPDAQARFRRDDGSGAGFRRQAGD
jgi:hypothetical protein